ncbi:MAG TPA: hypothetical protein DHV68_00505 [Dehalococcoidia bacterium]|nr:hypothetical protein [Dehalococcoidia bacterium]|tara:strand:- start:5425 stop:5784 length:360 start_codon:yes stop_codon:yes gene_type:complete
MTETPEALTEGLSATRTLVVEGPNLYSPTGKNEHSVLSSPAMIMEMELACVDAIFSQIGATVGFHVDVKHVAPTPAGETVETTATLVKIDGRKLKFEVETRYNGTIVGTGFHRRAIVKF